MLGFPASPFALARHLLDYPISDDPYSFDQLPLPTRDASPDPPPRPPRPDARPNCVSPTPVRSYSPSWMSPYEPSGDRDIEMSSSSPKDEPTIPQPREAPATPKSSTKSTRGTPVHKHSPITPSRLSLPPITADNTHDFTPASDMDSPYEPIYVVPKRQTTDVLTLVKKKTKEISKYNGPKPPRPRRRTISGERESSACRITDVDPEPQTLAATVRQLIHRYPEVSHAVPTSGPSPRTVASVKTKPRSFSFSVLAEKYTQASLDPNHPTRTPSPSPPHRQSSSRRYGPFTSSPKSPSMLSSTLTRDQAGSPNTTPRQRKPSNQESCLSSYWPTYEEDFSSPMERDSPENRISSPSPPKTPTPKSLGRSAFYRQPNSPLRHDNSSVRPLTINLPPPPSNESLAAQLDAAYPPTPRGTGPKNSGLTSPFGALWPQAMDIDKPTTPRASTGGFNNYSTEVVVVTTPPDFSRQYKRAGDQTQHRAIKAEDITMSCWNEEDAEGEIEYELETSPTTPKARTTVTLDDVAEGVWSSGTPAKDRHDREIDMFADSFADVDGDKMDRDAPPPPFEMPPTPRLAKATLPTPSKFGRNIPFADMPNQSADTNDMPAFLTPFAQRGKLPYNRSADFVLAHTRKREASIVRPPPGTIRIRKKRAQREITNLCVHTLQRNFSKALLDAQVSPMFKEKLLMPPAVENAPPSGNAWWGEGLSPPSQKKHFQLHTGDEEHDSDISDDGEDHELDDRGLWAEQSHGIGLGLGLGDGFNFKFPSSPRVSTAGSLPQAERFIDQHSPSPPLVRTPSGKGLYRSGMSKSFDTLSPALDLADRPKDGGLTPSPVSPEVVTPEFDLETGKRTVLVKENYKEHPRGSGSMFHGPWNRRLPAVDDDSDDDKPLWPRPTRKDKGKGKAVPKYVAEPPEPMFKEEPRIFIPDFLPIDPSLPDEVNYEAMANAFGVDPDELAMQYMLEMSKLDTGKAAEEIACRDSPGASSSGLPPCHSWIEDEDTDVEMSDSSSGPSRSSSTEDIQALSTSTTPSTSSTPRNHNFPAAFSSWYDQYTDRADNNEQSQAVSTMIRPRVTFDESNEISDLLDPLHIDDTFNDPNDLDEPSDPDDPDDTCNNSNPRLPFWRVYDDLNDNDYDNDDVDDNHDATERDEYEDGDDDSRNDDDSEYDDDDAEDDDNVSEKNDDEITLRDDGDVDNGPQDLDDHVDQKDSISNEITIMNRILMPEFTFTPPSPQVRGGISQPLRFGHKDDFARYTTRSPFLRVPDAPRASSSKDSPPFFRLAPAYEQPGKSGEQFANRMYTKWNFSQISYACSS